MELYINYSPEAGFSINSYWNNGLYSPSVVGLIDDAFCEDEACCPLDGALVDLKEELWDSMEREIVNELLSLIADYS